MAEIKTEFGIERIYVKDLSFEAPHPPYPPFVFSEKWQPDVDIKLGTKASVLNERESSHEVVLTVIFLLFFSRRKDTTRTQAYKV